MENKCYSAKFMSPSTFSADSHPRVTYSSASSSNSTNSEFMSPLPTSPVEVSPLLHGVPSAGQEHTRLPLGCCTGRQEKPSEGHAWRGVSRSQDEKAAKRCLKTNPRPDINTKFITLSRPTLQPQVSQVGIHVIGSGKNMHSQDILIFAKKRHLSRMQYYGG